MAVVTFASVTVAFSSVVFSSEAAFVEASVPASVVAPLFLFSSVDSVVAVTEPFPSGSCPESSFRNAGLTAINVPKQISASNTMLTNVNTKSDFL